MLARPRHPRPTRRPAMAGLVLATTAVLAAAGCGTGRSVAAYCDTFFTEGQSFRQRYLDQDVQRDPVAAIGQLLATPRDLAVFFGKLAEVAPAEIQPDVETVRDAYQQQADALGDNAGDMASGSIGGLAGSLFGNLATGLATAPAMQRVDSWTSTHCGPPPQ